MRRRSFLWMIAALAAVAKASAVLVAQRGGSQAGPEGPLPPSIAALTSMRDQARPITNDERRALSRRSSRA